MLKPEIEEFAKLLTREVRDQAILSCDSQLSPQSNSPTARRWREARKGAESDALAASMIPDCVDDALYYLLQAIDSGALRLLFLASNGTVVDLTRDGVGELAGWFMGSDGWRRQYSRQRFVDDCESLK